MMLGKYKYTEAEEKELLSSIVILVDTKEKVNNHITDYFDAHGIPYKKKALQKCINMRKMHIAAPHKNICAAVEI